LIDRLASFAPQSLHEVKLVEGIEAPDENLVPEKWKSDSGGGGGGGDETPRNGHAMLVGPIGAVIKKICKANGLKPEDAIFLIPPPTQEHEIQDSSATSSVGNIASKRQKKTADRKASLPSLLQSQVPDFHETSHILQTRNVAAMPKYQKPKKDVLNKDEDMHNPLEVIRDRVLAPQAPSIPPPLLHTETINVDAEEDEILIDEGGGNEAIEIELDDEEEDLESTQSAGTQSEQKEEAEDEEGEGVDDDEIALAQS